MKFLRYAVLAATTALLTACGSSPPVPTVERTPIGIEKPLRPVAGPEAVSATAGTYVVKKGDTLYSIARAHGVDPKDLASWNGIENSNQIGLGQQLRVTPPRADTAPPSAVAGGAVVQPIAQPADVEVKPITSKPHPEANTALLKREPKGGKVPYSEEALAKAKGATPAPAVEVPAAVASAAAPVVPPVPGAIEWSWPHNGKLLATFVEGSSKGIDIAGNPGDPVLASGPGKIVYAGVGLRGYGKLVIVRHNAEFLSAYAHNSAILVKEGDTVTRRQKIAEVGSTDADSPRLHFEIRRQGKPTDPLKFLPAR